MSQTEEIKVWDIVVRLFHWSLVILFITSYLTGEEQESLSVPIHIYSGYAIIVLLVIRLVWGIVGSQHARFKDFIYRPSSFVNYLKSMKSGNSQRYLGHNPAGGYMVLALLFMLVGATFSGLKLYGEEGHGPLANAEGIVLISAAQADEDYDEKHGEAEEFWEEIHEFFVNMTLFLVIVHIIGVIVSSRLHKENLAKAMITGKKQKR